MKGLVTKQLLFDFFDGKATCLQRKLVEEWLEGSANQDLFYSYLDEWERKNPQFFPDRESAQQKYNALLRGEAPPPPATGNQRTRTGYYPSSFTL